LLTHRLSLIRLVPLWACYQPESRDPVPRIRYPSTMPGRKSGGCDLLHKAARRFPV